MLKDLDLRDLDVDNIGIWPGKVKLFVIVLCCLMLAALGYFFDTKNQMQELEKAQVAEKDLLQQLEIKYQLVVNFPAYKKQFEVIQQIFKEMLQQLPGQTEVPGLLEDISKAGVASGLEFRLFKPLPEKQMDFYAELPIEISVVGSYHNLGKFVSKVSALSRIVSLHDYTITVLDQAGATQTPNAITVPGEKLLMNILAQTYRYTEAQKSKNAPGNSSPQEGKK